MLRISEIVGNARTASLRLAGRGRGAQALTADCRSRTALRFSTCAVTVVFLLAALSVATAEPKRVLLLHSFGQDFAPWSELARTFRTELDRQWPQPIDLYEASLAIARFADNDQEGPFVDYLRALFTNHRLDLVVTIGAPAASFFQRHRQQLFSSTPMLLTALEQRRFPLASLTANDTVAAVSVDFAGVVENILHVLPETTSLAVVIGNSPNERYWVEQMQSAFQPFTDRVAFTYFNELSFDDMLKSVAALPARSAIFFALLSVDAAGFSHEESRALARLHAVASAPIFSYIDAFFGHGIVGGPLISVRDSSQQSAAVAVRILRGETAGDIKIPPVGFAAPRFDWRELRRWGISEATLPAGSIVEFRAPTVFEQYRWYIIPAIALCALQSIFIVVLLAHRRRLRRANVERRKAEEAAHELSGRLINAQEDERSRLARELHDDVTQRLALLAIDAGRQERTLPKATGGQAMGALREGLVRLSEDVHALSHQLHPSILEDLGLSEALRSECKRFSELWPTRVELETNEISQPLSRDESLCLFRIAQEALRNVVRHAHASEAKVSLRRLDGGIQLVVKDDGAGFNAKQTHGRPCLGHASMRQRIHLLDGELHIDSMPGNGTTVSAWVPLKESDREPPPRTAG
jgi:signal transduction histidine kinase